MLRQREPAAARRRLARRGPPPGERPDPAAPAGTDLLPQIAHIVVLMMENHSYDNYLGVLAGAGGRAHGDGLPRDASGMPSAANPSAGGQAVRIAHFDGTVQQPGVPTQSWNASHIQFDHGRCDGFVRSIEITRPGLDAAVAMTYWNERDLPFYHALARTFALADRWFCSCLGPTFPNRRFLISGTAHGLIDDLPFGLIDYPPAGTIFDLLDAHGISWANYHHLSPLRIGGQALTRTGPLRQVQALGALAAALPRLGPVLAAKLEATANLYPLGVLRTVNHLRPIGEFFRAARDGTLPAVTIVDPDFARSSEENPQDIRVGEAFAARVIRAVMDGPGWPGTLLIWLYDEHGGYYDHVPPPAAVPPDDVPAHSVLERSPLLRLALSVTGRAARLRMADDGPSTYERLGFRVPAVIVSPYARPGHVSSTVYDHTSVLKLIERKWNLPPLTRRDAAAADPLDALDLDGPPAFATPPRLPPPGRAG